MIMYDNYNYPPGVDNEMAPWNQIDTPKREFDCVAKFTISKYTEVESNNYSIYNEPDGSYVDTDDISWRDEYYEQHLTPIQLIDKFKEYLETELNNSKECEYSKKRELKYMIKECEGWDWEDDDIYEDK